MLSLARRLPQMSVYRPTFVRTTSFMTQRMFSTGNDGLGDDFVKVHKKKPKPPTFLDKVKSFFGIEVVPEKEPEHPIFSAVRIADSEEITRIVKENKSALRERTEDGFNPLALAAYEDNFALVKHLISLGGRPNAENQKSGMTLLHYAARNGNAEMVKYLLEAKNIKTNLPELEFGMSPLHMAAANGRMDIMQMLVDKDPALVLQRDAQGCTPLHTAILTLNLGCVKLLLKANPKLAYMRSYPHSDELLISHVAVHAENKEIFRTIMQESNVPVLGVNSPHQTAAFLIATKRLENNLEVEFMKEYIEGVKRAFRDGRLFDAELTVDQEDPPGDITPEEKAAEETARLAKYPSDITTEAQAVKFALDYTHPEGKEACPLVVVAADKSIQMLNLLLSNGADPNGTVQGKGLAALHFAARANKVEHVHALLAAGANPKISSASGITPLHMAVRFGAHDVFEALVAAGADPAVKDASGKSALEFDADKATCTKVGVLKAVVEKHAASAKSESATASK